MQRTFDVSAVREQFPALNRTHNGRPGRVLRRTGRLSGCPPRHRGHERSYMERGGANLHGAFPTSIETEEILANARNSVAAFLGAHPDEISFGANMTTLTFAISRALARDWNEGDEVVVTELDHRANVDPWLLAAEERGAKVHWLPVDSETLTLNLQDLDDIVNENTKLVAVGLASNAVGTVNPVARIAERAREVGALVAVDAVHGAPHVPIDRDELGADILTCSAYKFFGPHVGMTAIRRDLLEEMRVYRLEPAPNYVPDKLETGTQNHEGIAGVVGALDFIASLGEGGAQREKLASAMRIIEEHESDLAGRFRSALREMPGVTLHAAPEDIRKTPTAAFTMRDRAPGDLCEYMAERGYFIAAGDFYASTLSEKLGIRDKGGFVRAGLAPYNTVEEVESFPRRSWRSSWT